MENAISMVAKKDWVHPFERTGLGKPPFRVVGFSVQKYQACHGAPIQPGSSCDYCGTGIMNVFHIKGADGATFKVGIDCVQKTYDVGLRKEALQAARTFKREAVQAAREASRVDTAKVARVAFIEANPGIEAALSTDHEISRDLANKLAHYGSLSGAQVDLAFKLAAEAYAPAKRPEVNGRAPVGKRQTIRGRVVKVEDRVGYMGRTRWVMTVKVEVQTPEAVEVWLCWGTLPTTIEGYNPNLPLRNHTIEFDATLEAGSSPHFAFIKRPTKARLIDATPTATD